MGCALGTTQKAFRVRRHLSLEQLDGGGTEKRAERETRSVHEQDRLLLLQLSQLQLADLLGQDHESYIVSSQTDPALHKSCNFASKCVSVVGSANDMLAKDGIGYACKKGLKPEAPNQDSFIICRVGGKFSLYGVFDGHGRKGHDVSNFVKETLPKILLSRPDFLDNTMEALRQTFETTQRLVEEATRLHQIDAQRSGCTASVVLHDHAKNILYTAHVGDSRCVLSKQNSNVHEDYMWQSVDLTEDHKPNLPTEKARIESNGGQVRFDGAFNYRVYAKGKRYPGLNMSRAMGDLLGFHDAGISAVPDVGERWIDHQAPRVPQERVVTVPHDEPTPASGSSPLRPIDRRPHRFKTSSTITSVPSYAPSLSSRSVDPACDKFLLLCSDGIWEFLSSDEAVQVVGLFRPHEAMAAAESLANESWTRWMYHMQGEVVDDITAVIVHLDPHGLLHANGMQSAAAEDCEDLNTPSPLSM